MPATAHPVDHLITLTEPTAEGAEAFRRLRTNVQFADVDRPLRTLAVAAARPGSGKSTIAANLAIAFAQAGKQVVLVDADLLAPGQHLLFAVPNSVGLVDVLAGQAALDECLVATAAPGVRLLPAGSAAPNPAQLLNGARGEALLDRLLEFGNLVLFDTPALAELADAALFAARMDGVVLVADSGHSRRADLRSARELLERVHANVLGVALNHTREQGGWFRRLFGAA